MLKMPRGMTLEKLTFGHVLAASDEIIRNAAALKVGFVHWDCVMGEWGVGGGGGVAHMLYECKFVCI